MVLIVNEFKVANILIDKRKEYYNIPTSLQKQLLSNHPE